MRTQSHGSHFNHPTALRFDMTSPLDAILRCLQLASALPVAVPLRVVVSYQAVCGLRHCRILNCPHNARPDWPSDGPAYEQLIVRVLLLVNGLMRGVKNPSPSGERGTIPEPGSQGYSRQSPRHQLPVEMR